MKQRSVKNVYSTVRDDIGDLVTRRALPTQHIDHLDPFLFLNHHGPQVYPQNNDGLPFGPHPHRGFETVTFILKGDLAHHDTGGHESVIKAGGIQWMTAGSGLVHSETSSEEFLRKGGDLEILQLWINLPSKLKMTQPKYEGLQRDQIPVQTTADGTVAIDLISGKWKDHTGPVKPLTDITLMTITMQPNASLELNAGADENIFFYVISGSLNVNGRDATKFHLVEFANEDGGLEVKSGLEGAQILFGHAKPYGEPIVSYGPFVMNTREEIMQAIKDVQTGVIR